MKSSKKSSKKVSKKSSKKYKGGSDNNAEIVKEYMGKLKTQLVEKKHIIVLRIS